MWTGPTPGGSLRQRCWRMYSLWVAQQQNRMEFPGGEEAALGPVGLAEGNESTEQTSRGKGRC